MEDKSVLIATYDGDHNHDYDVNQNYNHHHHYSVLGQFSSSNSVALDNRVSKATTTETINFSPRRPVPSTLDLSLSHGSNINSQENGLVPQNYNKNIEDYVASLAGDHNFTLALAAAVARSLHYTAP